MIVKDLKDLAALMALRRYAAGKEVKKDGESTGNNDRSVDDTTVHLAQVGQSVRPVK